MTKAMTTRLSHICMSARDLAATESFYVGILGMEIAHEFRNDAGERYGFFLHAGKGSFIEFFNKPDASDSESTFRHFCLEVDDLEAFLDHLAAHGIDRPATKRGRTDYILQTVIFDPDGNHVEIQQHDDMSCLKSYLPNG